MWFIVTACVVLFLFSLFRKKERHFRKSVAAQIAFLFYACTAIATHAVAYAMAMLSACAGFFVLAWIVIKILV